MNFYYLFYTLLIISIEKFSFSNHIKLCKNCIYYKPYYAYSEYVPLLSRCRRFYYQDIMTNKTMNDYATSCREDEDKCGKLGKCFEFYN